MIAFSRPFHHPEGFARSWSGRLKSFLQSARAIMCSYLSTLIFLGELHTQTSTEISLDTLLSTSPNQGVWVCLSAMLPDDIPSLLAMASTLVLGCTISKYWPWAQTACPISMKRSKLSFNHAKIGIWIPIEWVVMSRNSDLNSAKERPNSLLFYLLQHGPAVLAGKFPQAIKMNYIGIHTLPYLTLHYIALHCITYTHTEICI